MPIRLTLPVGANRISQFSQTLTRVAGGKGNNRVCAQMSIAFEHLPVFVAGDQSDLLNFQPCFKEPACAFVAQVVEMQVLYAEIDAGAPEGGSD